MDQKRKHIMTLAAGLGILLTAGSVFPVFADTVYVNATSLNYRTAPSTEAKLLGTLLRGASLEREKDEGEWSVVLVNGTKCYVASRYLSTEKPSSGSGTSASGSNSQGTADSSQAGAADSPYVDKSWEVALDSEDTYASFSKINSGMAIYYRNGSENRKGKTVCVNAGHGTKGGGSVKTQCHPDGTPKVTGGTTGAGAVSAVAVSSGMTFADGTPEHEVTLAMAKKLRDKLLAAGYDVLMIREGSDIQLDNVARTVLANNHADCHIALHWDSTEKDKGCFYMSVPGSASYRAMEPVASHWQSHHKLGDCLIAGLKDAGNKIFSSGSMEMDLTQTSYSTIPSVDIELGDKASSHSDATLDQLADGLLDGVNKFFEQ